MIHQAFSITLVRKGQATTTSFTYYRHFEIHFGPMIDRPLKTQSLVFPRASVKANHTTTKEEEKETYAVALKV